MRGQAAGRRLTAAQVLTEGLQGARLVLVSSPILEYFW